MAKDCDAQKKGFKRDAEKYGTAALSDDSDSEEFNIFRIKYPRKVHFPRLGTLRVNANSAFADVVTELSQKLGESNTALLNNCVRIFGISTCIQKYRETQRIMSKKDELQKIKGFENFTLGSIFLHILQKTAKPHQMMEIMKNMERLRRVSTTYSTPYKSNFVCDYDIVPMTLKSRMYRRLDPKNGCCVQSVEADSTTNN